MFAFFALLLCSTGLREECAEAPAKAPAKATAIRVTVVVVLATSENKKIDPKLKELAAEVRKRDKSLTGFKIADTIAKSIAVGDKARFDLVEKYHLSVKIEKPKDENGRVGLSIKPPSLGEITYTCACNKYFPIVTPCKTKAGEILIILVMSKPCAGKK